MESERVETGPKEPRPALAMRASMRLCAAIVWSMRFWIWFVSVTSVGITSGLGPIFEICCAT